MEQLDNIIFSFDAFAVKNGGDAVPYSICVAYPVYDGEGGCYCLVDCCFLSDKFFKMYGANEEQACELAISFVRQRVFDMDVKLVDRAGNEVSIPDINYTPLPAFE